MLFKERLRDLRKKRKLTQEELGKVLHFTRETISGYEIGRNQPSYEILKILANYFNVSIDYLLGNDTITNFSNEIAEEYIMLVKEIQKNKIEIEDIRNIINILSKNKGE